MCQQVEVDLEVMEQMYLLLLVLVLVIQIFFLVVAEVVLSPIQLTLHPQVDLVVEALVEEQYLLMVVDLEVVEVMVQQIQEEAVEEMPMLLAVLQQVMEDLV
tara:strand:+ start:431 stop:736 length:306 start_codon:yes stop_codon:yes gene_type:complete